MSVGFNQPTARYGLRCVACHAERMVEDLPVALGIAISYVHLRLSLRHSAGTFLRDHSDVGGHAALGDFVVINHAGEALGQCSALQPFTECLRERGHDGICSLAPETAMHGARRRGGW